MLNRITVDVRNRALALQGPGPIESCLGLDYIYRLSQAGEFSATFPIEDERTLLIATKTTVLDFYWDGRFEFRGIVEQTERAVNNAGVLVLSVRGRDMLGELAEAPVGFLDLSGITAAGTPNSIEQIITTANNFAGTDWGVETPDIFFATGSNVYAKFAGESALLALIKLSEHLGEPFRVATDGSRTLIWLRDTAPDSGVRAIGGIGEDASDAGEICLIQSFAEVEDGFTVANRIYPYGAGNGDVRQDLRATSRTAPSGYVMDTDENYIESTASITALGKRIGTLASFQDVRPISNTDADVQAAANALFDAAIIALQNIDMPSDLKTYSLSVTKLSRQVEVGETMRVIYSAPHYEIDDTFIVLALHKRFQASGQVDTDITVGATNQAPVTDDAQLISDLDQSRIFTVHPQVFGNSYTTSYRVFVGENQVTDKAEIRFWFGDEVVQIQQVLLRFKIAPVVSTSTASLLSDTTTGSSSTSTTAGGSAHSHTVASHTHTIDDHQHTILLNEQSGGGIDNVNISHGGGSASSLGYDGSSGAREVAISLQDGGDTSNSGGGQTSSEESSHSHGMDHTHDLPTVSNTFGIFREDQANTLTIDTIGETGDLELLVNSGDPIDLDTATALGNDWYQLDLTALLYDDTNFRPLIVNNEIEIRTKTGYTPADPAKTAMIDALLSVRNTIQSINYS